MAILNDLDFFPADHQKRADGGREGNWMENSCSCLYAAAIAKGVRKGVFSLRRRAPDFVHGNGTAVTEIR